MVLAQLILLDLEGSWTELCGVEKAMQEDTVNAAGSEAACMALRTAQSNIRRVLQSESLRVQLRAANCR